MISRPEEGAFSATSHEPDFSLVTTIFTFRASFACEKPDQPLTPFPTPLLTLPPFVSKK